MAQRRTDCQDDEIVVSSEHVKLVEERCLRHRRDRVADDPEGHDFAEALDDVLAEHHPSTRWA